MKKTAIFIFVMLLAACTINNKQESLLSLVNPFIGTDGHGHTFPGAAFPFGMVQLSPDTRKDNWDACSGYHYSDKAILGFSHLHLSGTGVGDYGDIRFMPITGELKIRPGEPGKPGSGYQSAFSHEKEKASPGYYEVFLDDYGIKAELTVTPRCGFHQYTFPGTKDGYIIIDLKESAMTEKITDLTIQILSDHEICGYRRSSYWADDQKIYFYAEFSRPFDDYGTASDGVITDQSKEANGKDLQAFVKYSGGKSDKVLVKVGISAVSTEGAKLNLASEIPGWDFNIARKQAADAWYEKLSKVEVNGAKDDMVKFYSALYHCYIAPNLYSDVDGKYRGHDGQVHTAEGFKVYTVFSLWDTYRALHPLMTILEPGSTNDFIRTFLDIKEKGGLLPVWELAANETNCMIGYHAVPVIADAYQKGIAGYDADRALDAMIESAEADQFGLKYYREYGYIPAEMEGEAVSKTLEYAYDDWCIAMMAKGLGRENDYVKYLQRAQYYKNLFDPETKFIRGKRNGMFTKPFDPAEVNFMLTEANTWQYTFYVPQDITGLADLMGGDELFAKKLDDMFTASSELSGRDQSDITGLIGQYAHGNEPSHHMAYLYNYAGQAYKSQKLARQIMREMYGTDPAGLCGNEDCGQMSAWFVMSAIGLYPVTPGTGDYAVGSPLFDEVKIHLENGNVFTIRTKNNNSTNFYIQSASYNGNEYVKSFFTHKNLLNGGILEFEMGPEPNAQWAAQRENRPESAIKDHLITPVPYFDAPSGSFQQDISINIRHVDPEAILFCNTENGKGENFTEFKEPINTDKSISLNAYATRESTGPSKKTTASFIKIHRNWNISIINPYSNQYNGGGDLGLIDGQHGGPNFRTGSWQGYQEKDFVAVIDMGEKTKISKVSATFLQDQRSWIFMPESVEFAVSQDDIDFMTIARVENQVADTLSDAVIKDFSKEGLKASGRYLRVTGTNRKICPAWHVGAGDKAWLFVDEITVE
jgi:predicted alpha-1,2-mannosidase